MQDCYRHPGRETGVSCSNCDRPICPDCMTPTPVGMRCPECSKDKTKVMRADSFANAATPLTQILIAINVFVFLIDMATGGNLGRGFGGTLTEHGALFGPYVADGDVWRLVTGGFLHGGILHIMFNMYALYFLGGMLEPALGRTNFLIVYFVSLLVGSLGALLQSFGTPVVGASGAIFGLMGAAVVYLHDRGINPMESGLGPIILLNLVLTFTISNISVGGHLGGLAGGALAAWMLIQLRRRSSETVASLATAAVGVAAVAVSLIYAASQSTSLTI